MNQSCKIFEKMITIIKTTVFFLKYGFSHYFVSLKRLNGFWIYTLNVTQSSINSTPLVKASWLHRHILLFPLYQLQHVEIVGRTRGSIKMREWEKSPRCNYGNGKMCSTKAMANTVCWQFINRRWTSMSNMKVNIIMRSMKEWAFNMHAAAGYLHFFVFVHLFPGHALKMLLLITRIQIWRKKLNIYVCVTERARERRVSNKITRSL